MPAYVHTVAHNNLIFKYAIVPDMGADHNEVIVPHFRHSVRMHTGVDCHLLAERVSVTYYKPADSGVRPQSQYLRPASKRAIGEKAVVLAYPDIALNDHIGIEDGARPD
jgi:hypothetical protein